MTCQTAELAPIILFGSGPAFGLPEGSPYVTKTLIQLKLAGVAYQFEADRPQDGLRRRLPTLQDADRRIADSTFIRGHVEATYGVDLDEGLTAPERATAWALERLAESLLAQIEAAAETAGACGGRPEDIEPLATRSLWSLATLLGDRPFMMGPHPTSVDGAVFGVLAQILAAHAGSPIRRRAEGFANLVAYVDRMMAHFFPEHPWTVAMSPRMAA
jgi:glutathione S-transferase